MKRKKQLRPKTVRDWQRKRTVEWRRRYYAQGYTYKKLDGHWGWIKRKRGPSRIHSNDPKEIEMLRRKIMEARK
jgi:hypothetical protein